MELEKTWGALRGYLRETFSFAQIKDVVGAAGIPSYKLANFQQKFSGGVSKGQLMDEVDKLFAKLTSQEKSSFVANCVEIIIEKNPASIDDLNKILERIDWGINNGKLSPLKINLGFDTTLLPDFAKQGIDKCLIRLRHEDLSGAMTAICGTIDTLTEELYTKFRLHNHKEDPFQSRVSNVFKELESYYKQPLIEFGLDEAEINLIWRNHQKSVSQAAYVLGACRRGFADVHGEKKDFPIEVIQRAIDCALYITRSITILLN